MRHTTPASLRDFDQVTDDITSGAGVIIKPKMDNASLWINHPSDNNKTVNLRWVDGVLEIHVFEFPIEVTQHQKDTQ